MIDTDDLIAISRKEPSGFKMSYIIRKRIMTGRKVSGFGTSLLKEVYYVIQGDIIKRVTMFNSGKEILCNQYVKENSIEEFIYMRDKEYLVKDECLSLYWGFGMEDEILEKRRMEVLATL